MLRIVNVNVNGIRAAMRKNMQEWADCRGCDILTLQEVRAQNDIAYEVMAPLGEHAYSADAEAKGRAGVAVVSDVPAVETRIGNGDGYFDLAGRWLEADYELEDGSLLTVVSAYVHSGEVGTPKQDDKYRFMDQMKIRMDQLKQHADYAVITGDLNVGHTELDIKNWKGNVKKAGFLPEERAYFDEFFGSLGWVDVHRQLSGEMDGPYTWWSMRGKAFDNDTGWRIDYQMATPELAKKAVKAQVDKAPAYDQRWSDHAPLVIDYDLPALKA
ncbi:exodeoxyribonuclease III [Brevibacterium sp. HMSC063G07]|uniref:exodeoxyribonuclease III n=1 Tax=Brevibacterium sp. HMSC063G07 TaxID=1739261 RepID=UPI000B0F4C96|nr:exodeoxyribonuclease III [Brevibacterium sp. HMSC063G07]